MSLFYSNPLGGRVGFFQFCASPLMPWLGWIVLKFRGFCRQLFAHFLQPALAHFLNVVYFFNIIWIFLWHINVFNVRHGFFFQIEKLLLIFFYKYSILYCTDYTERELRSDTRHFKHVVASHKITPILLVLCNWVIQTGLKHLKIRGSSPLQCDDRESSPISTLQQWILFIFFTRLIIKSFNCI